MSQHSRTSFNNSLQAMRVAVRVQVLGDDGENVVGRRLRWAGASSTSISSATIPSTGISSTSTGMSRSPQLHGVRRIVVVLLELDVAGRAPVSQMAGSSSSAFGRA